MLAKIHGNSHVLCLSIALSLAITPAVWAGATLDGSPVSNGLTTNYFGTGTDFTIPDTVGTTRGTNLFHSFNDFSINAGESATFTGPGSITNVISRVTGDAPSTFNGTLTSLIDPASGPTGANFVFINPNGLIFKEGAVLNIGGSFTATTSNSVNLGQDGVFYADLGMQSILTSPAPSAFGFLNNNPSPITLEGTQWVTGLSLNMPFGAKLSLIGGNITLGQAGQGAITQLSEFLPDATGSLIAPTGNRFELVSVASIGDVIPVNGNYDLSSFGTLGDVTITGGSIIDSPDVYIHGGKITISDGMIAPGYLFLAQLTGPPISGGSIDITATEQVSINGTAPIQTFAAPFIQRPSGQPFISGISTFAGSPVPGPPPSDAADININGGNVSVSGLASVTSGRFGPGQASNIAVTGDIVEVRNGAIIANVNSFAGAGGNITIDAQQVMLDGESDTSGLTGLNASSTFNPGFGNLGPDFSISFNPDLANGAAGNISVSATGPGGLTIRNGASISTESRAFGTAGDIIINASDINLSRDGMASGAIASQSIFAGDSGNITIHATGSINIDSGFVISGNIEGTGSGGSVSVTADNSITITGDSSGIANASPEPSAAVKDELARRFDPNPDYNFDALLVDLGLPPDSTLFDALAALQLFGLINLNDPDPSAGNAGPISVAASTLNMNGLTRITSSTTDDGDGGTIGIQVGTLAMTGGAEIRSRSGLNNQTTGHLEVGAGNGGDINIVASNAVNMQSGSSISASSQGTGLAGDVAVDAGNTLEMNNSSITTQATVSDGGNIQIAAVEMIHLVQSDITTSVESGTGAGGNIDIDPDFVILQESNILANAFGGPGGNINIVAGNFIATPDSSVDASSALGIDGAVNISSPDETVSDDLAVLPDSYLDVTSLIGDRCGTSPGSSSLVDAGPGGRTIDPDGYLPSFVATENYNNKEINGDKSVSNGKRWWAPYAHNQELQLAQVTCTY